MQLTKDQNIILDKYLDDCRFTYNKGVEFYKQFSISNAGLIRDFIVTKTTKKDLKQELYKHVIKYVGYILEKDSKLKNKQKTKNLIKESNYELQVQEMIDDIDLTVYDIPESIYNTPKSLRYNTIRTLETNIKSANSNLKNNNIKYYDIKFKSKKNIGFSTIEEDKCLVKLRNRNNNLFIDITGLKNLKIKLNKKDKAYFKNKQVVDCAVKLKKTNIGWFIYIPYKSYTINTIHKPESICGLDPGQRTFLTGIDLSGNMFKLGEDIQLKLNKLKLRRNKLQSKYDTLKSIKNNLNYKQYNTYMRIKYEYYTTISKIRNYITELHNKSIKFLTDKYDKIILPIYNTQNMIKTKCNKFNTMMLSLNHYEFKQKLINKCISLNKTLIETTEYYTSKTCGNCGNLKHDLYTNKIYNCNICNISIDRDINGAFNILKYTILGSLNIKKIY